MLVPALLFLLAAVNGVLLFVAPGVPAESTTLALLVIPVAGPAIIGFLSLKRGQAALPAAAVFGGGAPPPAPPGDRGVGSPGLAAAAAPVLVALPPAPRPAPPSPDAALRLLATLQEEARLLDFVSEDISSYDDAQVGAAARGIHASLRKALLSRLTLEPVLPGEDGDRVEVPAGFDAGRIRVTGSPKGQPPYRGELRHGGWVARDVKLPAPVAGSDAAVLAPAEVEV